VRPRRTCSAAVRMICANVIQLNNKMQVRNMTSTAIRILTGVGLFFAGTTVAAAQAAGSPGGGLPGTGNSTSISQGNRANNAEYNHLIATGDDKPKPEQVAPSKHAPVAATAQDIKAGASLRDIKGTAIGRIASLDADQVIVDTGQTKIGVPLSAFGKDDNGLLLGTTADKFNQLVAQAHAKTQGSN
jgi:hypothetical protein